MATAASVVAAGEAQAVAPGEGPEPWDGDDRSVLRLHLAYLEQVVEASSLCPWARRSREDGRSEVEVVAGAGAADAVVVARVVALAEAWRATGEGPEVLQLVLPEAEAEAPAFRAATHRVVELVTAALGARPAYAVAAFHPQHEGSLRAPGGAVGVARRSPFPMQQWVRLDVLEAVRAPVGARSRSDRAALLAALGLESLGAGAGLVVDGPDAGGVSEQVTARNHALLSGAGGAAVVAQLDELRVAGARLVAARRGAVVASGGPTGSDVVVGDVVVGGAVVDRSRDR